MSLNPASVPRHPDYKYIETRLQSFKEWPIAMPITKEDLGQAGFFYLKIGDQVRCFHCGGCLNEWKKEDSPIEEHNRHFGHECHFIKDNYSILKRNARQNIKKGKNATPDQIKRMEEYMDKRPDLKDGSLYKTNKVQYNDRWDELKEELNLLGPEKTVEGWKEAWKHRKDNKKRPKNLKPKILKFSNEMYINNTIEKGFHIKLFKFNFHQLWETILFNDCYATLNGSSFLTAELVYVAANVLLLKSNNICLDPYQALQILGNKEYKITCEKKQPEIEICRNKEKVFIPSIIENCHFVLTIIDFKAKTIACYDPMSPKKNIPDLVRKTQNFVAQIQQAWNVTVEKFKSVLTYNLPKQKDGFNCGPLVLYAIDVLSNNVHRSDIHCPDKNVHETGMRQYREHLKQMIVSNSESVIDNCLICFGRLNENEQTTQCLECKRQIHNRCNQSIIICSTLLCIFCEKIRDTAS